MCQSIMLCTVLSVNYISIKLGKEGQNGRGWEHGQAAVGLGPLSSRVGWRALSSQRIQGDLRAQSCIPRGSGTDHVLGGPQSRGHDGDPPAQQLRWSRHPWAGWSALLRDPWVRPGDSMASVQPLCCPRPPRGAG